MNGIVKASLTDAIALNDLVNCAYRGELSRKGWASEADLFDGPRITVAEMESLLKDPDRVILKYLENDRLLGCVALHKQGQKLYLGMLTVHPERQGGGLGKKLMATAEDEALKNDCSSVFMTVITLRKELLAWYARHGYPDTGKRMPFDKEDPRINTSKIAIELAVLEKRL